MGEGRTGGATQITGSRSLQNAGEAFALRAWIEQHGAPDRLHVAAHLRAW
jgi:hypothetical protein